MEFHLLHGSSGEYGPKPDRQGLDGMEIAVPWSPAQPGASPLLYPLPDLWDSEGQQREEAGITQLIQKPRILTSSLRSQMFVLTVCQPQVHGFFHPSNDNQVCWVLGSQRQMRSRLVICAWNRTMTMRSAWMGSRSLWKHREETIKQPELRRFPSGI